MSLYAPGLATKLSVLNRPIRKGIGRANTESAEREYREECEAQRRREEQRQRLADNLTVSYHRKEENLSRTR